MRRGECIPDWGGERPRRARRLLSRRGSPLLCTAFRGAAAATKSGGRPAPPLVLSVHRSGERLWRVGKWRRHVRPRRAGFGLWRLRMVGRPFRCPAPRSRPGHLRPLQSHRAARSRLSTASLDGQQPTTELEAAGRPYERWGIQTGNDSSPIEKAVRGDQDSQAKRGRVGEGGSRRPSDRVVR